MLSLSVYGKAQVIDDQWSDPYRLSSIEGEASEPVMLSDQFGNVHIFWSENGFSDNRSIIQYTRYDGDTWSTSTDIYISASGIPIESLSADIGEDGRLYLAFTNGQRGPILILRSNVHEAISAKGWTTLGVLDISAYRAKLRIDSRNVIHVLISNNSMTSSGVYYYFSDDNGIKWSYPVQLDLDIPHSLFPELLQFEINELDQLHALWYYNDQNFQGKWIRYSNSIDNGKTWTSPFTIDKVNETSRELLLPSPSLVISGNFVHTIWAGDSSTHRSHRYSEDMGVNWNTKTMIFGDLHGQAIGDGVAVDGVGRTHFIGQLRYPHGLYHVYFENGEWSTPNMFYLIARDAFDSIGDRIHAHRVRLAIRAGYELVTAFTSSPDSPQSILYTMVLPLSDIPNLPINEPKNSYSDPEVNTTMEPSLSLPDTLDVDDDLLMPESNSISFINLTYSSLVLGLIPVLILLIGIFVVVVEKKRQ